MTRVILTVALALSLAPSARAADPALETPRAALEQALACAPEVRNAHRAPVLLLHGTGNGGRDEWSDTVDFRAVLAEAGYASCIVELPSNALVDVQTSAEYVVHAIRRMRRLAGRRVALYGHSQGGLLARWALTYWPTLRRRVADVVTVAGSHHGTTWGTSKPLIDPFCGPLSPGCPGAFRQQTVRSNLIRALDAQADATPGTADWVTVRTLTDELVQPQDGPQPASGLTGATDVVVQNVCPGREVGHSAVQYDSVAFATLIATLGLRRSFRLEDLPASVCEARFAPGLDPNVVTFREYSSRVIAIQRAAAHDHQTKAEPPLRPYAEE